MGYLSEMKGVSSFDKTDGQLHSQANSLAGDERAPVAIYVFLKRVFNYTYQISIVCDPP